MTSERFDVQRQIAASPAAIFAVLSSPAGHVQIDSSGMLQSASGPNVTAVGDTFVVHMDRESLGDFPLGKYDINVLITELTPDTSIEWTVVSERLNPPLDHRYGYTLEAKDGGTLVSTYYDWSRLPEQYKEHLTFPIIPEQALKATLGILARTVEGR